MEKSSIVSMAMLFLAVAFAAADSSRGLLGTAAPTEAMFSKKDFKQCGGKGGLCEGSMDTKCKDAEWPANGSECKEGLDCTRSNPFYWGCALMMPSAAPTTTTTAEAPTAPMLDQKDFKQCGGEGGLCQGSMDAKCKDALWPAEGGMCKAGLMCMRSNPFYWGCAEMPPPTEAPKTMKPTMMPTMMPTMKATMEPTMMKPTTKPMEPLFNPSDFKQCGGIAGLCSGSAASKCKDAAWPADKGGRCKIGLTCYRVSKYYWGCDVAQPPQDDDPKAGMTSEPMLPPCDVEDPTPAPTMAATTEPAMASTMAPSGGAAPASDNTVEDYKQCGGYGGSCAGMLIKKCKDAAWPAAEDQCKTGMKCYKISQFYWQCDVKQPPTDPPTTEFMPADFKQCGGSSGLCSGSTDTKCKDAEWPADQGGSCKTGLKCTRISEFHWGCDLTRKASK